MQINLTNDSKLLIIKKDFKHEVITMIMFISMKIFIIRALCFLTSGRLATWKQPRSEPMLPLGYGYTVDTTDK